MNKNKLDSIIEHAETVKRLANLLPKSSPMAERRISAIISEADVVIDLTKSFNLAEYVDGLRKGPRK
jgi:hypothetical protein